jgi:hypothetical protein
VTIFLDQFFKLTQAAKIFGQLFFLKKSRALKLTKHGLGHILGDFLQLHLVTLLSTLFPFFQSDFSHSAYSVLIEGSALQRSLTVV